MENVYIKTVLLGIKIWTRSKTNWKLTVSWFCVDL